MHLLFIALIRSVLERDGIVRSPLVVGIINTKILFLIDSRVMDPDFVVDFKTGQMI